MWMTATGETPCMSQNPASSGHAPETRDGESDATGNEPFFEWPSVDGPAREVWYAVVAHPEEPLAFWWRYTIVQTSTDSEVRVWAAVSDGRPDGDSVFVTEAFDLDALDLESHPFRLTVGADARLADDESRGRVGGSETTIAWAFDYEHDSLTFTPIRDESVMRTAAEQLGTGCHWSANQSIEVDGTLTIGDEEYTFSDAAGHQGHTAGTSAPDRWVWAHCNTFEADISLEALRVNDRLTSVCLRLPEQNVLINRQETVFGEGGVTTVTESATAGTWAFRGETEDTGFDVRFDAERDLQCVSYLTPDESLRYNTHCSLADVELHVDGDRYRADGARIEWVQKSPPRSGSYPPFEGRAPGGE